MPGRLAPASLRWAQGVPPPPKQSFPRAPQSPRQGRDLAPSPASRARLPRGRPERARAGGGPRRPPAAGRPQAAAGERLPAGGGARAAEPGVLRGRTGPAERRAGERALGAASSGAALRLVLAPAPEPGLRGPPQDLRGGEELFPGRESMRACSEEELGHRSSREGQLTSRQDADAATSPAASGKEGVLRHPRCWRLWGAESTSDAPKTPITLFQFVLYLSTL